VFWIALSLGSLGLWQAVSHDSEVPAYYTGSEIAGDLLLTERSLETCCLLITNQVSGRQTVDPVIVDVAEQKRLNDAREAGIPWKKWGPYLSERHWGTVREDYSENGREEMEYELLPLCATTLTEKWQREHGGI
jgi:hypothetical protein